MTSGWPGWTAPKSRNSTDASSSTNSDHRSSIATDAADPRVAPQQHSADAAATEANADWLRVEETAKWLETITPQSRLDAYPIYVLCRELLRKVMQRYVFALLF